MLARVYGTRHMFLTAKSNRRMWNLNPRPLESNPVALPLSQVHAKMLGLFFLQICWDFFKKMQFSRVSLAFLRPK